MYPYKDMCFAKVIIVFSAYFYCTNGHIFNNYKYVVQEINENTASLDSSTITTEWIEQPLDHFNDSESRTWNMKYFQRLDTWTSNGPIFIFVGGEWNISPGFIQAGQMYDLAVETNGAMFMSEHRYYGDSKPFNDSDTENFQYLSSRQALADLANLINNIKGTEQFNSSKVILAGCSYSGSLVAWMKHLYPDLIDAVIASSGPVLAKADFYEYLETVGIDFKTYGSPECYNKIVDIFSRYEELLKTESGIEQLKQEKNICDSTDMTVLENKELFFMSEVSQFENIAQTKSTSDIKQYCDATMSSKIVPTEYDELGMWNEEYSCTDYDLANFIESIKTNTGYYPWFYQTCTEFGFYQTTAEGNQPFTNNLHVDLFYKACSGIFGPEFDGARVEAGVKTSNELYGGLKPNVTKTIFVSGEMDPWHRLSILNDLSNDAPAIVIPGASHCKDIQSNQDTDSDDMIKARAFIKSFIKKWI